MQGTRASSRCAARRLRATVQVPSGEAWPRSIVDCDSNAKRLRFAIHKAGVPQRVPSIRHLTEAEDAHEVTSESLSQMASSIAHEVNQPLAAIVVNGKGALRWLNRDGPNIDEARMAIERIIRNANHAAQIISSIRSLMKKESDGRVQLDLNELVNDVLALADDEIRDHRVSVQTELTDTLPLISADRVQLHQVILNLIKNAIQAMASIVGRKRVLLLRSELRSPESVVLTIQDCGIGITADSIDRIFEPFFRLPSRPLLRSSARIRRQQCTV
jgi:C4-dicarboxylate-specific signal transduction histidine kinase